MKGCSSSSKPSNQDYDSLLVDDFYFSALHDSDELLPISDEKYAQELQLQEALYSSAISNSTKKFKIESFKSKNAEPLGKSFEGKKHKANGEEFPSSHGKELDFCAICMDAKPAEEMFRNKSCTHSYCGDCVGMHVAAKIQENISNVKCPEPRCRGFLEPQDCRSIVPREVFDRWESALCENLVLGTQRFYCPFKDCSAMLLDDGGEVVTVSECPHCNRLFCAQCKVSWHEGLNCGEFMRLNENEREREDLMVMELAKSKSWMRCPKCKYYVEKTDGCSHITCRCGHHFCYVCGSPWPCGKH